MSLLRLFGAGALLLAAIFVSGEYSKFLDRRIAEYRGIAALLSHAEGGIERSLSYGGRLWQSFEDEALERCGLLSLLREGKGLSAAFGECMDRLALSKEAKGRIAEEFSALGKGYMSGEIATLSALRRKIEEELSVLQTEAEKSKKVARALLIGGALALGVMII